MGNFFKSLFSSSKVATPEEEKSKNDQKNFDILKYDGVRAQKIGQVAYAIKCFTEALKMQEDFETMTYLVDTRVDLSYKIPLAEIIFDFFDKLKSATKGYASLDYQISGYQKTDAVKLDILLNGDLIDALSIIVHKSNAASRGRVLALRLKDNIQRQQFEVPIQAAVGSKIIARETIKAYKKDVLAKCYGGDVSRKKKLLEKQKEGKKRMKQVGSVEIPQEAFMAVLKDD